jgi:hypothetical protein
MLVDLAVPADADAEALRVTLARWAQQTRYSTVLDVPGVRVGDARGVIVPESMDAIVRALTAVAHG